MPVLSPGQIYALARDAGFDRGRAITMTAIALAESGGDSDATNVNKNGSVDTGLWQINSIHGIGGNLKDPRTNARAAKTVYDKQGYGAWVVFNNNTYQRHLGDALDASSKTEGASLADVLKAIPVAAGTLTGVAGQVAGQVADNVTDPLQAVGQIAGLIARAGTFINNPQNWLRIAYVGLGVAMVIGGLVIVARPLWEPAAEVGVKAAKAAL